MQDYANNTYFSICCAGHEIAGEGLEGILAWPGRTPTTFGCWRGSFAHRPGRHRGHAKSDRHGFSHNQAGHAGMGCPRNSLWLRRPNSKTGRGKKTSRSPTAQFVAGAEKACGAAYGWRSVQFEEMGSRKLRGIVPRPEGQRLPNLPGIGSHVVKKTGFSLRVCFKRFTGSPHPDRDRQFRIIERRKAAFLRSGDPVLSVDTKKKELIGNFANTGRVWRRKAIEVNAHDFKKDARGRAVPYGLYDLATQTGHVRVGISGDTPAFAASAIAHWWKTKGRRTYSGRRRLLVLADAGGSNDCRKWAWKYHLQEALADRYRLKVHVCHYPTGASKWNPVEHRLFGPISTNWAGEPLSTFGKMLRLIRGTQGIAVTANLDRRKYETQEKILPTQIATLCCKRARVCPNWNYVIVPRRNPNPLLPPASGP
jgi:hypothetical protein